MVETTEHSAANDLRERSKCKKNHSRLESLELEMMEAIS